MDGKEERGSQLEREMREGWRPERGGGGGMAGEGEMDVFMNTNLLGEL